MEDTEIVKKLHRAIEDGDTDTVRSLITDDFVFDHKADEGTMDRDQFIEATRALQQAFPDLDFNLHELSGQGDVSGKARVTGTHTGVFDLSIMGGPKVEATGKTVRGPEEPAHWTVRDGKVAAHSVEAVEGGGISGQLEHLGVETKPTS